MACLFFFFQAEDGIRDVAVTGVQTCALPICFLNLFFQPERAVTCLMHSARPIEPIFSQFAVSESGLATIPRRRDRKSTRLNSSHGYISYAVFCLKKKKKTKQYRRCEQNVVDA